MSDWGAHSAAPPPTGFGDGPRECLPPPPSQFATGPTTPPAPFGFGDDDDERGADDEGFVVIPPPPKLGEDFEPEATPPPSPVARGLTAAAPTAVVRQVRRRWDVGEGFGFAVAGSPPIVSAVLPRANGVLQQGDRLLQINGVGCAEASAPTVKHLVAAAAGRDLDLEILRSTAQTPPSGPELAAVRSTYTTPPSTPQHRLGKAPLSSSTLVAPDRASISSAGSRSPGSAEESGLGGDTEAGGAGGVDWDGAVERKASGGRQRRGSVGALVRKGGERARGGTGSPPGGGLNDRPRSADRSGGHVRKPMPGANGRHRGRRHSESPASLKATVRSPQSRLHSVPAHGGADLSKKLDEDWVGCDPFGESGSDVDESSLGQSMTSSEHSAQSFELTKENLSALQRSLGGPSDSGRAAPRARTAGRLSGWLSLETVPGSWAGRWCKLSAHDLILFADSLETRTLGCMDVLGAEISVVQGVPLTQETFAFELRPTVGPVVRLCTTRWDERQTWMRALRRAAVKTEELDALARKELENRIEKDLHEQCGPPHTTNQRFVAVARQLSALKSACPPVNPSVE